MQGDRCLRVSIFSVRLVGVDHFLKGIVKCLPLVYSCVLYENHAALPFVFLAN